MDVLAKAKRSSKEVIALAKQWVAEQYDDEDIKDITLEEVRFGKRKWYITIGFKRKRVVTRVTVLELTISAEPSQYEKALKVVSISDDTGEVISMHDRFTD